MKIEAVARQVSLNSYSQGVVTGGARLYEIIGLNEGGKLSKIALGYYKPKETGDAISKFNARWNQ